MLEDSWSYFTELNSDQWFVSFWIETTSGAQMPPERDVQNARQAYSRCERALSTGNLKEFHALYPASERTVNEALNAMRSYRAKVIRSGENWVTGLKFTKTASFTFVGVFAAPATGAALGTGVVASSVIGGAAASALESSATEVGNWSAGRQDWTAGGALSNVLIDTGVGAILGGIARGGSGGRDLVEAAVERLVPKLAQQAGFNLLSSPAVRSAAVYLLSEGGKKVLEGAVKDAALAIKDEKKMSMEKFFDNVANNFIAGMALAPVGKVIEGFAKRAAAHLDPTDEMRIWDLVARELVRQSGGSGLTLDAIDGRTRALMVKAINDQVAKQLDNVLAVVYDNWKGPMSPQAFQKKVSELVTAGQKGQKVAAAAAQAARTAPAAG
jgi:uncharacterized protein YfiM (DUF2279 family)